MNTIKNMLKLCFAVLVFSNCFAQQKIVDSLEKQLDNPTNGLTKLELLNELSWYYANLDPERGIEKAEEAIALALDQGDSLRLGIAYERKGYNFQNLGMDSLVLETYKYAEDLYEKIGHTRRLAALAFNLGNFHLFRANYKTSLEYGNIALNVFESNKDTIKIARVCNQMGTNHMYLGDYSSALETLQKGTLLLELSENEMSNFNGEIQSNIGLLHEKLSDFNTALEFQEKALRIYRSNDNKHGVANSYNNIGKLYGHMKEHNKSLEMFKASYDIKKGLGNKYRTANALTNIGIAYSEIKDYEKALDYLSRSKEIYITLGHNTNLSAVYKNIGEIYIEKGELRQAQFSFEEAILSAQKAEDKRALYLAKEGLAEASSGLLEYKKAYMLQKEAKLIKEEVISNEKRDDIANIKAQYKYDKEKAVLEANFEKDKAIKEAEIKQQIKNRNISIGVGLLLIAASWFGLVLFRRRKEADLNTKIARSQLQTLKAQMNPHFIFNSLNSINEFVQKNEKEYASDYLVSLSEMMRKVLEDTNEDEILLADEIDFLESYLKLEQQRLNNAFEYSIVVEDYIDKEETLIPPALLQPIVENSIWHGFNNLRDKGKLNISFSKKQGMLICIVEDNGTGIKSDSYKKDDKPFGTRSIKERLDLLNEQKGTKAKIEFIKKEQGVKVKIYLPFIKDE